MNNWSLVFRKYWNRVVRNTVKSFVENSNGWIKRIWKVPSKFEFYVTFTINIDQYLNKKEICLSFKQQCPLSPISKATNQCLCCWVPGPTKGVTADFQSLVNINPHVYCVFVICVFVFVLVWLCICDLIIISSRSYNRRCDIRFPINCQHESSMCVVYLWFLYL